MKSLTKLFRRRPGERNNPAPTPAAAAASAAAAEEFRWLRESVTQLSQDREAFRAQLNSHGETLDSLAAQQEAIRKEIASLRSMADAPLDGALVPLSPCARQNSGAHECMTLESPAKRQRVEEAR